MPLQGTRINANLSNTRIAAANAYQVAVYKAASAAGLIILDLMSAIEPGDS